MIMVEIHTARDLDSDAVWGLNDIIKYALEAEGIDADVYTREG